jgi:hypothetical protein
VRLATDPSHKKRFVWFFEYTSPKFYDAEFEIYISLVGQLVSTNPKDLRKRLRKNEKLSVHPYLMEK